MTLEMQNIDFDFLKFWYRILPILISKMLVIPDRETIVKKIARQIIRYNIVLLLVRLCVDSGNCKNSLTGTLLHFYILLKDCKPCFDNTTSVLSDGGTL